MFGSGPAGRRSPEPLVVPEELALAYEPFLRAPRIFILFPEPQAEYLWCDRFPLRLENTVVGVAPPTMGSLGHTCGPHTGPPECSLPFRVPTHRLTSPSQHILVFIRRLSSSTLLHRHRFTTKQQSQFSSITISQRPHPYQPLIYAFKHLGKMYV